MPNNSSDSIPGEAPIRHEAGDTLVRTIKVTYIDADNEEKIVNLTGATIVFEIAAKKHGAALATITPGDGILNTEEAVANLELGIFDIFWQTGELDHDKEYWYRGEITLASGQIVTILESPFTTT